MSSLGDMLNKVLGRKPEAEKPKQEPPAAGKWPPVTQAHTEHPGRGPSPTARFLNQWPEVFGAGKQVYDGEKPPRPARWRKRKKSRPRRNTSSCRPACIRGRPPAEWAWVRAAAALPQRLLGRKNRHQLQHQLRRRRRNRRSRRSSSSSARISRTAPRFSPGPVLEASSAPWAKSPLRLGVGQARARSSPAAASKACSVGRSAVAGSACRV